MQLLCRNDDLTYFLGEKKKCSLWFMQTVMVLGGRALRGASAAAPLYSTWVALALAFFVWVALELAFPVGSP